MGAVAVWLWLAALVLRYASLCGSSGNFSSTQLDVLMCSESNQNLFLTFIIISVPNLLTFFGGGGHTTGLKDLN